ncbi:unnamed protein product [Arabis nemorensis]|uniref:Uncharacterized protein n=1 Tax=Arabis nemorensis TaxID=586526 RepID=A0A565CH96_9BRAS|nr:unnamed protein product [Arabis nemorensis]
MSGKSSPPRRDKSEKKKNIPVDIPAKITMFAVQDELLTTRHEILKEDHESLKQDYASLEVRFKHVEEMNEIMKSHLENQLKEPEAKNQRLLKDIETEKEEKKKIVEEIKRMEDELKMKNEELLILKEEAETDHKKMEDKYNELVERFGAIVKDCSYLKSLCDDENLTNQELNNVVGQERNNVAEKVIGRGGNNVADDNDVIMVDEYRNGNNVADDNEVIMVDEYRNVNNTVTDTIVISDGSDTEYDNPPRESNITPQMHVGVKQEEQWSNGANSSQVGE